MSPTPKVVEKTASNRGKQPGAVEKVNLSAFLIGRTPMINASKQALHDPALSHGAQMRHGSQLAGAAKWRLFRASRSEPASIGDKPR